MTRAHILTAAEVRAVLDGRKTQFRKVLRPPPGFVNPDDPNHWDVSYANLDGITYVCWPDDCHATRRTPWPFMRGQQLLVREAFVLEWDVDGLDQPPPFDDGRPLHIVGDGWRQPHYRATDPTPELDYDGEPGCKWRSSMHMPRWASRLTLTVTDVRVQRLQDISEADVLAEGVAVDSLELAISVHKGDSDWAQRKAYRRVHLDAFRKHWNATHKPGEQWVDNPWVCAVTFDYEQRNIDTAPGGSPAS